MATQMDDMGEWDDDEMKDHEPQGYMEVFENGECAERHPLRLADACASRWEFVCGRAGSSDVCLNYPTVSQKHATISARALADSPSFQHSV